MREIIMKKVTWDERKDQLKLLAVNGLSNIDIAKFFNTTVGAI